MKEPWRRAWKGAGNSGTGGKLENYINGRIKSTSRRQELYASFAEKNGESEKYQKAK